MEYQFFITKVTFIRRVEGRAKSVGGGNSCVKTMIKQIHF